MLKCSGQGRGAPNDAGGRPIAPPSGARRAQERLHAAQQRPRAPVGLKRALKGPTAHLRAPIYGLPTPRLRPHLARRCSPSHAHAARAHAALGAALGGPVPPSHARARLGGCSARYSGLPTGHLHAQCLRPTSTPPPPTARASRARPRGARRPPWRPCAAQPGTRAPTL